MKIIGYIIGFIWCLPHTIAALLLMLWYRPQRIRWRSGCLEFIAGRKLDKKGNDRTRIWGKPGGQSIGCPVIGYATEEDWDDPELQRHERIHTIQGMVLGLLFGPLYLGHWALIRLVDTPDEPTHWPAWKRAYWEIWAESQARRYEKNPKAWT